MAKREKRYSFGVLGDVGAFAYELAMAEDWSDVRDQIREEEGGEMAIYEMISQGGIAFETAQRLENINWEVGTPRGKIWDDEIIGFVERVMGYVARRGGKTPGAKELLEMARRQMKEGVE